MQRGDTLYGIAFRNQVDLRELIAWNDLAEPYTIYPGQRLRIGSEQARSSESIPVAEVARTPRTTRGTEPLRVARGREIAPEPRFDEVPATPPDDDPLHATMGVAPAPSAADSARRVAGAAPPSNREARLGGSPTAPPVASLTAIPIAVDDGVREAVADDTGAAFAAVDPDPSLPPVAMRSAPPPDTLPQTPAEPRRDSTRVAPTRMVGGIGWRWPNSATLVGRYAAADEARQGIRLQGPAGTPVNATADGEVVYSGNGLVGLGELVIIKHGSEYLSAYGLNRKRLVTEGQKVSAGQPVAEMGNSAGVAGLLHFEVRRNGRPIDPLTVLPPR
ncbi:MAG: peptidoglycan DD-metalloendopeptidase family protein [Lysobacterales bacterium]